MNTVERDEELARRLTCSLGRVAGNRLDGVAVTVDDQRIVIVGRARSSSVLQLVLGSIRHALNEAREHVSRIELITDHLRRRGSFRAVCTRPTATTTSEIAPWQPLTV